MLRNFICNNRGYGTVEFLLILSASAVIAGAVYISLVPNLKHLHESMERSIRDVSNTGF